MAENEKSDSVVVLALDDLRFGLSMNAVERVIRAVEVSPLPDAPAGVLGVVNVHGCILPVYDIRPRFGLASREMRVSDHLVIARAGNQPVALLVDAAIEVVPRGGHPAQDVGARMSGLEFLEGIMLQGEHIVPVQDLGHFLPSLAPFSSASSELKLVA